MDMQKRKNTIENIASWSDAINERNFNSVELLQEIEPLLKEYFIGNFEIKENALFLNFLNGQKFRITAEEV